MNPFVFEDFKRILYDDIAVKVPDAYALFDQRIDELHTHEKVSASRSYRDAKNSLKRFKLNLNLTNVPPGFPGKYENHMISKERSITTISMYLRHLRYVFN